MALSTVTFPAVLDHSWSFSTSAIHARPQKLTADGQSEDSAAILEQQEEDTFTLAPSVDARWTDDRPVTLAELHIAISRAVSLLGRAVSLTAQVVGRVIVLHTTMGLQALRELLASAPFSLTPCIRLSPERHTSGDFIIRDIREGGRLLELERRDKNAKADVDVLELISIDGPAMGQEMLAAGELDLTRVLGGAPEPASAALNEQVDTVMGLRSAPGESDLRSQVTRLLDVYALADATGGAYDVMPEATSSPVVPHAGHRSLELAALAYADFYPNHEVVVGILDRLGLPGSSATPLSYPTYLAGEVKPGTLRLDLVDTLFGNGRDFSGLLRARTTIAAGPRVKDEGRIVTRRAEIDWAAVRLEES